MTTHTFLVAVSIEGDMTREQAETSLHYALPRPNAHYPSPAGTLATVECWWVTEDDRRDGSDNDSAVFDDTIDRVEASGARVGIGAFSDTAFLEHLGCKGINWGVGYHDYHSTRGYAYLDDTFAMVDLYRRFHAQNEGVLLEHTPKPHRSLWDEWEDDTDDEARWEREYERYLDWDYRNDDPTPEEIERAMSAWDTGWADEKGDMHG